MQGKDGAVLTYSVPLDLGKTESWKRSGGRIKADGLLLLEGTLENRGRTPARVMIFAVLAPGGTEQVSEAERNLRPGGPDSPVLFDVTLAPRERLDLSSVSIHNQEQVGRMVFGGLNVRSTQRIAAGPTAIRIGVLALSDGPSGTRRPPAHIVLRAFDLPLNRETFAAGSFVPGDRWIRIDGMADGTSLRNRLFLGELHIPNFNPAESPRVGPGASRPGGTDS